MGKPKTVQRDLYERINYLYQAANVVLESNPGNNPVSNFYGNLICNIAKRGVLKLDPSIKRTLCKKCNALLIPGVTSSLRIRGKRETHLIITCLQCRTVKRFLCRHNYNLWCNQPEALASAPNKPAKESQTKETLAALDCENETIQEP